MTKPRRTAKAKQICKAKEISPKRLANILKKVGKPKVKKWL